MSEITSIFSDPVIIKIANSLKTKLNTLGNQLHGIDLVRGIRDYDTYNVALTEFPLLKVYRVADNFVPNCAKVVSFIQIDYCLSYPQNENLSSVCNNITKYIHRIVNRLESEINLSVDKSLTRQGGYKIIQGANAQSVYAVISYTFTITEGT